MAERKIAIIGAGPAGLTLARLLEKDGASVRVYERDENRSVRVQGATLDLHEESGLKALRAAGLLNEFRANYRPGADRVRITDRAGQILFEDSKTDTPSRPEIDRGPLRELLLDSLKPETVVWNHHFASLAHEGDGWRLLFKNAEPEYADFVIGADGANSRVRPAITSIKSEYCGFTIVEGAVGHSQDALPEIHKLLNGGKIFALADEKSLIISSKGDGSLVFYLGLRAKISRSIGLLDRNFAMSWFKKDFSGWEFWLPLFEKADPKFILRPLFFMPLDQNWTSLPNLTMLGDAAHLMPPYAGEGVNMAMLDALELAEALRVHELPQAVAVYEGQMRTRASEITSISLKQTESIHSPHAVQNFINIMSGG